MAKIGLITGFLGRTTDRFHTYNEPKELEEKLRMVSQMDGVDGIEVVFPYEVKDAEKLKQLVSECGLHIAAVNVNVKAEPEFRDGGLTSTDKAVRAKAVQFIKDAKDFAKAAGADKVTCCPLGDGYEHSFQCNYARMWGYLVETFGQAGAHLPDVPLHIEYKPSETRGRCFVNSAAKTICLLNEIGNENMGVTLDFGHSIYGRETPAEAVSLIAESPFKLYVHINDNDGLWDWDYTVGTHHFLKYVEFLYTLQGYGYDDYLTSDTSPTRVDIQGAFETNARVTNKLWAKLQGLDRKAFDQLIAGDDYLATWRFIEENILGL